MSRESLGGFELMMLVAVMRAGEDAYGVTIARTMRKKSGREVFLGSVYPALERLEAKGVVATSMGDATAARGGKAKKYFRVTAKGLKDIRGTQRTLVKLCARLARAAGSLHMTSSQLRLTTGLLERVGGDESLVGDLAKEGREHTPVPGSGRRLCGPRHEGPQRDARPQGPRPSVNGPPIGNWR